MGVDLLTSLGDWDTIKLIIFWSALVIGVPLTALACSLSRRAQYIVLVVLVVSLSDMHRTSISFFAEPIYRSAIRGFDILLADLCALVLGIVAIMQARSQKINWLPPLTLPYMFYIGLGILSWALAAEYLVSPDTRVTPLRTDFYEGANVFYTKVYPWYELTRIFRGFIVFWVIANYVRNRERLMILIGALGAGAALVIIQAFKDRYIGGIYRISAGLMHPNDLAGYACMLAAVLLPYVFIFRKLWSSALVGALVVGLAGATIMTLSRSGLTVFAGIVAFAAVTYLPRYFSARNILYGILGVTAIALGLYKAADVFQEQFTVVVSIEGSIDERMMFNQEAALMASEHPFGVGLGNFSAWSWEGYAERIHAELAPGVIAHNIWFLTLAELGYLGVIALAAIWIRTYQIGYQAFRVNSDPVMRALILGVVVATLALHFQSLVHYTYRNPAVYHLTQVLVGAVVGLYLTKTQSISVDLQHV